jgi:Xaa-Pro aminopeptidase
MLFFLNLAIGQSGNPADYLSAQFHKERSAFRAKMPANTVAFW